MSDGVSEVLERTKRLLRDRKDSEESQQLLVKLPQGHGSGLNADTVDGMHAAEILAKAPGKGGGGSSGAGGGDMTKAVYDPNDDGRVMDSDKLQAKTLAEVQNHAPQEHGDEAHSLAYALSTELADHEAATTDVHGVGAGTIAKVGDIAVDANLSAAAQDAINKKHSQGTDTDLDPTFEATFEKVTHKDAANGYAGLSAASKLAASQMPAGTVPKSLMWHIPDALTTGQKKMRFLAPCDMKLTSVKVVVDTAPTGANLIVDIHTGTAGGTTIFTTQANRPTISAGNKTGTDFIPDITDIAEDTEFSLYIDQIGSTVAGSDLTVELIGTVAVAFA